MLETVHRNTVIAKRVATILALLAFLLLGILLTMFGPNVNSPLIFAIGLLFLGVRVLISSGHHNLGRMILCMAPPLLTLTAAVLAKVYGQSFTDILYYDSRFFLILQAIIPCLVFDLEELAKLASALLVCLLTLLFFDPVHEYFNVGYFQKGFGSFSYYYINYVVFIVFVGITGGAIVLKKVSENAEQETMKANRNLSVALNELAAQNEEINAQKEELASSQEQLVKANTIIEAQKMALQKEVHDINKDLGIANRELATHNNELRQFSYTISHNLRGPIARLLGLANLAELLKREGKETEVYSLIDKMKTSAEDLDTVIRDLSLILELRNSLHLNRTQVSFVDEWNAVRKLLNIGDDLAAESFSVDFSKAPVVHSFGPMLNSILFNLTSNAIKYRSPNRPLRVNIHTAETNEYTVLHVADNGLGIDLGQFHEDLFKLYKRFHLHQEGKGLGLYLVKAQAEMLNGYVEVDSTEGQGSSFRIFIRKQQPAEDVQLHHEAF